MDFEGINMHLCKEQTMHYIRFGLSLLTSIFVGLLFLFWHLQNTTPVILFAGLSIIFATALGSMSEYKNVWHALIDKRHLNLPKADNYRGGRFALHVSVCVAVAGVTVIGLFEDVQSSWQTNEILYYFLLLLVSFVVLASLPIILIICDKDIFAKDVVNVGLEKNGIVKKLRMIRRIFSFTALREIVLAAFLLGLVTNLEDVSVLRHMTSSLLVADAIFCFIKFRYISNVFDSNTIINPLTNPKTLAHVSNAFGRLIVYIVLWRRLHLTDAPLEEMGFYDDDVWWLVGSAALFLIGVIMHLRKTNVITSDVVVLVSFGAVFALFFVITAFHHHHRVVANNVNVTNI